MQSEIDHVNLEPKRLVEMAFVLFAHWCFVRPQVFVRLTCGCSMFVMFEKNCSPTSFCSPQIAYTGMRIQFYVHRYIMVVSMSSVN